MRTKKRAFPLKALLALLIIALGLTLTACFSEEPKEPEPTEPTEEGGGPTALIRLSADPASIPADGSSSSAIRAELNDDTGGAVALGTSITFSTDLGVFPNGDTTYTVTTSSNLGIVTASLIAGTTIGEAIVTAQSNGVTQAVVVSFTGEGIPGNTALITLTADPASIPADGASSSAITATLGTSTGAPVSKGTTIAFSTTRGHFVNGTTTYSLETPDESGVVSASLIAGTLIGEAIVTAQSNGVTQAVAVFFTGEGIPGYTAWIALTASPASIPADGASSSAITADLKTSTGEPVPQGTAITFATTLGRLSSSSTTTPDDTGKVTVSLISGTAAGTATVTATSRGISQAVNVTFTGEVIPPAASSLSLSLSQPTVKSDNSDKSTITATVLDSNNAVIEGVMVSFTCDGGQLSTASQTTDQAGVARTDFSSGTTDRSNRVVTITASVSGLAPKQIPVQIVGTTLTLSTDAIILETGIGGNNTATLTITARDASLMPIYDAGITVTASPAGKVQLTPTTGNTDVTGKLRVQVTALTPGNAVVTAAGLGATGTQNYTIGAVGSVFTIIHPTTDPYSWNTMPTMATTGPRTDIAFNNLDPDTITGPAGIFAGFLIDDKIMVVGSASNDGIYTIATVAAGTLTLVASDQLTTEAAGASVTVTTGVLVRVNAPDPITDVQFATTLGTWDGGAGKIFTKSVDPITHHVEAVLTSGDAGTANILVSDADDSSTSDGTTVLFSAPSSQAAKIALQANKTVVAPSTGGTKNSVTLKATVKNNFDQVVGGAPVAFSIENPTGGGEYVSPPIVYTGPDGVAEATFTSGSLSTDSEGVTVYANVVISSPITTGPQADISFHNHDPAKDTIDWVTANFIGLGFSDDDQIAVAGSADNDGFYTTDTVAAGALTLVAGDQLTDELAGASVAITYAIWDSIQIVIGGAAGSVLISPGTTIESINNNTMYKLPMSVQVADSNGNPMTNTTVSLSVWPLRYATGCWVWDATAEEWAPWDCDASCNTYMFYPNEDDFWGIGDPRYRNLILDPGEDIGPPGFIDLDHDGFDDIRDLDNDGLDDDCGIPLPNPDLQLTPPNSAAGTVPGTVTTDENGVATFNLVYGKASAAWIEDAITASTLVYGTETKGTYTFVLSWLAGEEESLPHSPYNFAW